MTATILVLDQVRDERDRLTRLSETQLVSAITCDLIFNLS